MLILADHWGSAWRILRELGGLQSVTAHALICNNTRRSAPSFIVRQVLAASRAGVRGVLALVHAAWCGRVHVRTGALHDASTVQWLQTEQFWLGLHAMGVIYRKPVLDAFARGVLNAHIGLLPEFRGRSVMEWSVLAGTPAGVTVFFMDDGIDTGRDIVVRRSFDVNGAGGVRAAKSSLFARDGAMYRLALDVLTGARDDQAEPVNEGGRRYFVMSSVLTAVVDDLVASGAAAAWETRPCLTMA